MAKANPIDVELVRSLLEYAPELGGSCLRWKIATSRNTKAGDMAGGKNTRGYWHVRVKGRRHCAHRLVWAIVKGEDPQCQVDHMHGVETGNHIENLRLAPNNTVDNGQNRKVGKNNKSGYIGVSWHKRTKKWRGDIKANGVWYWLGYFDTPEEAYAAYLKAKEELHAFQPIPRG